MPVFSMFVKSCCQTLRAFLQISFLNGNFRRNFLICWEKNNFKFLLFSKLSEKSFFLCLWYPEETHWTWIGMSHWSQWSSQCSVEFTRYLVVPVFLVAFLLFNWDHFMFSWFRYVLQHILSRGQSDKYHISKWGHVLHKGDTVINLGHCPCPSSLCENI